MTIVSVLFSEVTERGPPFGAAFFALSPDGRFLVWPEADEAFEFPDADRPGVTRTGCRLRRFKEWAYAGAVFTYTGAAASPLAAADGAGALVPPQPADPEHVPQLGR